MSHMTTQQQQQCDWWQMARQHDNNSKTHVKDYSSSQWIDAQWMADRELKGGNNNAQNTFFEVLDISMFFSPLSYFIILLLTYIIYLQYHRQRGDNMMTGCVNRAASQLRHVDNVMMRCVNHAASQLRGEARDASASRASLAGMFFFFLLSQIILSITWCVGRCFARQYEAYLKLISM